MVPNKRGEAGAVTLRKLANGWSALLVSIVANVAPWLAPLPTAWLVYERTMTHLAWPQWVAITAGATLEALGVGILATALELYNYNRDKRKTDPQAPLWIALVLVVLYFTTAILLTVVLDIAPAIALVAPALFPVLSVASFALLALRADHERRVNAIAMQKADAKTRREQLKREREQAGTRPEQAERSPEQPNDDSNTYLWECPRCDFVANNRWQRAGHQNKHRPKELIQ